MLSPSARPVLQLQPQYSGDSLNPTRRDVVFRRSKSAIISAAYASPAAERETGTCVLQQPKLATSFYQVLEIPMGATSNDIKTAYRRLATIYHPDVAAIDRKSSSAEEFMKIHAAYSTLSDPDKRADYDRGLFRRHRSLSLYSTSSPSMSRFSGYTGRNWETDQCW